VLKNAKLLTEFGSKKCFRDYLKAVEVFDGKEITECWSLLSWVLKAFGNSLSNTGLIIDAGCGVRPSLGTMAALFVSHGVRVACIDPSIYTHLASEIRGLSLYAMSLRDFVVYDALLCMSDLPVSSEVMLLCNHSHSTTAEALDFFRTTKATGWYITVPCCVDNTVSGVSGLVYKDSCLISWTPKSTAYAYRVLKGKFVNAV